MIFNVDSNCVHLKFQFRVYMWARVNISAEILDILRKSTSWNQVLWSLAVSNVIPGVSWYLRKSPYASWFIFRIIDSWWFLMDFWCSHVMRVLRTPSHPHDECPKCPGSFSRSLIFDDFWSISGVFMWCPMEESASHPLSSVGWVPQVCLVGSLLYESFQQ